MKYCESASTHGGLGTTLWCTGLQHVDSWRLTPFLTLSSVEHDIYWLQVLIGWKPRKLFSSFFVQVYLMLWSLMFRLILFMTFKDLQGDAVFPSPSHYGWIPTYACELQKGSVNISPIKFQFNIRTAIQRSYLKIAEVLLYSFA